MLFDLLGDQVAFCDFDLFMFGIAGQADDFHPVQKRARHVECVGRGHEHHVRQVIVDLKVVIVERAVLFGVQNLK